MIFQEKNYKIGNYLSHGVDKEHIRMMNLDYSQKILNLLCDGVKDEDNNLMSITYILFKLNSLST